MRIAAAITAALLVLGLVACGDDETTSIPAGATGATGAQGVESEAMTVDEYLDASIPEQLAAVEDAVKADDRCGGADTSPGGELQVSVAIDAAAAESDQPLSEIVAENC